MKKIMYRRASQFVDYSSLHVTGTKMLAGNVGRIKEIKNAYRILIGKPKTDTWFRDLDVHFIHSFIH